MSDISITPTAIQSSSTLSRSNTIIFYLLMKKPLTVLEIHEQTDFSIRTISSALKVLLNLKLIKRIPNLSDMRSCYYQVINY